MGLCLLYWLLVDMGVERHCGWHYPQVGRVLKLYKSVGVRLQAWRWCDVFLSTSDVVWIDAYIPKSSPKNWAVTQIVTLKKSPPHLNCFGWVIYHNTEGSGRKAGIPVNLESSLVASFRLAQEFITVFKMCSPSGSEVPPLWGGQSQFASVISAKS